MQDDDRVPLSRARHGARFWRRPADYGFARMVRQVPLALAEVEAVAATLPLAFARGPEGLAPVALLRLATDGPSVVVSPAGLWLGRYVPSLLRVHPFAAGPAGDGGVQLMVHEASGLVTDDPTDEPFFAPSGGLAPATAEVLAFFRQREASALRARTAAAGLEALGLLAPLGAAGGAGDGLLQVARARLDALDDAAWLGLRRSGALTLAQAHLVSLAQLGWLGRAEARRTADAVRPPPATSGDRGVESFLAALAACGADQGAPLPVRPSAEGAFGGSLADMP